MPNYSFTSEPMPYMWSSPCEANLLKCEEMQEMWNIMRQTFENVKHAQQECAMIYIAVQPNAL